MKFVVSILIISIMEATVGEIYTSIHDISETFLMERRVVRSLEIYVSKTEEKIRKIKKYLSTYENIVGKEVKKNENFHEVLAVNPIQVFHLIRRLTVDWKKIEIQDQVDDWKDVEEALLQSNDGRLPKLPHEEDLQGAAQALVRLQSIYNLNTTAMANGCVMGVQGLAELRAQDCLYMGKHSFNMGMYSNAVEWFEEAYALAGLERNVTVTQGQVMGFLNTAIRALHEENVAVDNDEMFAPIADRKNFQNVQPPKENGRTLGVDISVDEDADNFEALCRGEQLLNDTYRASLACYYSDRGSAYYKLRPLKVEIQMHVPPITIFHDVISDNEIQILKNISKPQLSRAMVQAGTWSGGKVSSTRTSKVAWLENESHSLIKDLNTRISLITGLNLKSSIESSELLQIANYGIGGYYNPHYDYFFTKHTTNLQEIHAGDRIATFMFYLSDVIRGGATAFPKLGVALWPTKGSAAFWYNLKASGNPDPLTLHGACPVVYGSKWVSNKWIRERPQYRARPCSLVED